MIEFIENLEDKIGQKPHDNTISIKDIGHWDYGDLELKVEDYQEMVCFNGFGKQPPVALIFEKSKLYPNTLSDEDIFGEFVIYAQAQR